ncbi:uncharacterized protein [Spinacia oleracea]|uniref:DUF4218 domain-containing protein n=1 Tax=Spinacia oleracea TaxID=3562 RepID=A0ABM3QIY8_SPIOL|nr:uncharacterized protein LOC110780119 [Spinacia oleracea]
MDNELNEENMWDADRLEELTRVIEGLQDCPGMFENITKDVETPLYHGCTDHTRLSTILGLYNIKTGGGWTDKSFTKLLNFLKVVLPKDNTILSSSRESQKMLGSMGMSYERIHACRNDCILYRKEYASLKRCPECNVSRYKKKGVPAKVLWYFPIVPRLRRLFSSPEDAKNLTWHANGRKKYDDGMLRHPADCPQWIKINTDFPDFAREDRNLRLALATDGMNPFGGQSSSYSVWPVIMVIYNLPPELCMKRKYMMMSMLISGPKQPGNDIDVYLAPLIEDLKMLWDTGVEVFDASCNENFTLRAMVYGTINDFPAYRNLSGYCNKGYKACPICDVGTSDTYLKKCGKVIYPAYRRFLPSDHHYRRQKKAFNGKTEGRKAPVPLTGDQVLEKVKGLNVKFGKQNADLLPSSGYKKRSIFFDLPYWSSLYVRNFLDVMHIEKNVFESLLGTLLNVPGKTKDGKKSRLDLVDMGIREELHPQNKNGRTYLPPACHTLSRKEKVAFCEFLKGVKVPEGYSSNISSLVSMKDLKLIGLKSHDSHILLEHILPVSLRSILPERVRRAITRLCFFFAEICRKVIDPQKLTALQKELAVTLCELEMFFPPSFFDIMVHLTVHLVRETQLCGPAYLRWMYPIERFMKVLKGYVMNRSRPEGCMVQRYLAEEAVDFCSEYLFNFDPVGLPEPRCITTTGKGIVGNEVISIARDDWRRAHLYVLHNSAEVEPYVAEHMALLRDLNLARTEAWIASHHNLSFIDWLRTRVSEQLEWSPDSVCERLKALFRGPRMEVMSYSAYRINGYTFYTEDRDYQSTMQNSGVTLEAEAMHISTVKDKNPVYASMSYYGVIDNIWELDYNRFRIPVFRCKWVGNNNGIEVDNLSFTRVDFRRASYTEEPFILASQARQIFFVADPKDKNWNIVLSTNRRSDSADHVEEDMGNEFEEHQFPEALLSFDDNSNGDELYKRSDHSEGIWIRPSKTVGRAGAFQKHRIQPPRKKRKILKG